MKHIFLLLALTILNACSPSPQVTVTLTPPPTLTSTPIVVDGIAEDAKGNKLAYLNGEWIILPELEGDFRLMADKDGIRAVDSDGKVVYEYDMATGEWLEAAEQHFADLGYPTDDVEYIEGEVNIRGIADGRTVFTMNIKSGEVMFDQDYVIEQAGEQELMLTDIEPRQDVLKAQGINSPDPKDLEKVNTEYMQPLLKQFNDDLGIEIPLRGAPGFRFVLLDPEINSWGVLVSMDSDDPSADRYLYYRDVDGKGYIVPLMPEK